MVRIIGAAAFVCLSSAALYAQAGGSTSSDLKKSFAHVKENLMKSAEKMPDADYSFKPSPDIRSFAEVISHVVTSQSRTCSAAAGESKPVSVAGKTSKADIVSALEESFEVCDNAYNSLTDANASETVKTARGEMTRMGLLVNNVAHDSEQYGLIAMYLRAKNLIPPSSEKK